MNRRTAAYRQARRFWANLQPPQLNPVYPKLFRKNALAYGLGYGSSVAAKTLATDYLWRKGYPTNYPSTNPLTMQTRKTKIRSGYWPKKKTYRKNKYRRPRYT